MTMEGKGYRRLKPLKSLAEILDVAIEFEKTARDFYTALTPKVSKQLRYLVEELAQEEQGHFDLFSEIRARPDLESQIGEMVETPASDARFSDCILLPELGDKPDDQGILFLRKLLREGLLRFRRSNFTQCLCSKVL